MERFERLVVDQIPSLRRYARALTGEPSAADDLVQDTLARALSRRHLWVRVRGVRPWLFTIMHNLFVNDFNRRARTPTMVPVDDGDPRLVAATHPEQRVLLRDVDRALAQLPPDQREVVLLVALEQLSYKEAAQVLDVPTGTVMSRLSRGRERLRRLLAGEGGKKLRRVK